MAAALHAPGFNALPESPIQSVKDGMAAVMLGNGLETQLRLFMPASLFPFYVSILF